MPQSPTCTSAKPPKPPPITPSPNAGILTPLNACPLPSYSHSPSSCPHKKSTTPHQLFPSPSPPHQNISPTTLFAGLTSSLSSASLRSALGLHPPPLGHIDWLSIFVVYWIILVSEASRGLMLPSTWPYFKSMGGSKGTLGVFVASFSMGRMATTIPLGFLSDNYSTSTVLIFASLIQVFGHIVYALAPTLSVLYASRVIVGFGSATMSVCRAHITRAVPSSLRTYHFAYLSALQFVGFAVLPGAGGLLALLPEFTPATWVSFNGFTYPAFMLAFCNIVSMLLIYSLYFNPPDALPRPSLSANASPTMVEHGPDVQAMVICLLVNVVFRGVVAEFETVSTPFLMDQFDMSYGGASFRISFIGFSGLFVYLAFKPIATRFADRSLVVFGLLVVLVGCFPLAIPFVADNIPTPMYVFFLGLTWSLAYPIGQTAVLSLFSKVLMGLPAGGFLGVFSATGSLARVGFAMLAGLVWSQFGRESVFAMIMAYTVLAVLMVLLTFNRLVPAEYVF